jgi:hypothetical protein
VEKIEKMQEVNGEVRGELGREKRNSSRLVEEVEVLR